MDLTTSNVLPPDSQVDVRILSQLFNHTTNSYKLLFFFALLDALERTGFQHDVPISVSDLVLDMLVNAWYPHVYFKLSFGKADKTTEQLDRITIESIERSGQKFSAWNKERIRECIASVNIDGGDLARYVPYRLVRPFFPKIKPEQKKDDHRVNRMVAEMSVEYFTQRKPLYKITGSKSVEVHPDWCTYLRDNLSIVKGWASWNYLQYMQKANPLVPNLSLKLFPPAERESLASQTKFWNKILEASAVTCIYTGEQLTPKAFALDHFLPWSFVVHNEPWNLIPVSPQANSAKSDRLPAAKYFEPFIATQHSALRTGKELLKDNWKDTADLYAVRLKVSNVDELLNLNLLTPAYERLYQPQIELAKLNGFQADWSYRK